MKYKAIILLLTSALWLTPPAHAQRVNLLITVGSSPVRVVSQSTPENRLLVQSRHGNSGIVYVLMGVPVQTTCSISATNPSQLTAELGPGDSLHPGGTLSDPQGATGDNPSNFEDLQNMCIAGSNPGDTVIVSFWGRV